MDFKGQRLAEDLIRLTLIPAGIIGFIAGLALQSFSVVVYVVCAAALVLTVLIVPAWPFFKTESFKWVSPEAANRYLAERVMQLIARETSSSPDELVKAFREREKQLYSK